MGVDRMDRSIRTILLGRWPHLTEADCSLAGVSIETCRSDRYELERAIISRRPSWLILGGEIPDDRLIVLHSLARCALPGLRVAVVGEAHDLDRCHRWVRLGINAYISEDVAADKSLKMIRAADELRIACIDLCFQELALVRLAQFYLAHDGVPYTLTRREKQTLQLIGIGMSNSEIAARLGIGVTTVEYHATNIFAKMGVRNRTEAAVHISATPITS